jgi:enoyl-CoA hydratase/carnithine racemase
MLYDACARVFVQLLDHAKHVRYIMLRGAGTHFSGGIDLKGMSRVFGARKCNDGISLPSPREHRHSSYHVLCCVCATSVLYEASRMGEQGQQYIRAFFRELYQLNFITSGLRTPLMSFLHGTISSSSCGLVLGGKYRFASPNVQFSLPECRLGFIPDAGATYHLARIPGLVGMYIALTGQVLNMGDLLYTGLATHAVGVDEFTPLQQLLMASEYDEHMDMHLKLHFPVPPGASSLSGLIEVGMLW